MLTTLSPIYEEEVLYSWLARNYKFCSLSPCDYNLLLLGNKHQCNPYITHGMNHLIDYLNRICTYYFQDKNDLINKTTLVPFYTKLCNDEKKEYIYKNLPDLTNCHQINSMLNLHKLDFPYGYLRLKYCPKCAEEQYDKYGEIYLIREHQILHNYACNTHKILLNYYDLKNSLAYYDINDLHNRVSPLSANYQNAEFFIDNSQLIHYFFTNDYNINHDTIINLIKMHDETSYYFIDLYCKKVKYYNLISSSYSLDIEQFLDSSSTYEYIQLIIALYKNLELFQNNSNRIRLNSDEYYDSIRCNRKNSLNYECCYIKNKS